jgi:hypothetical protein
MEMLALKFQPLESKLLESYSKLDLNTQKFFSSSVQPVSREIRMPTVQSVMCLHVLADSTVVQTVFPQTL